MPLHNLPCLLLNPLLAPKLIRSTSKTEYEIFTPLSNSPFLVVLIGLIIVERSYLWFYGEIFSSASISDVQEGGFVTVASE